MVNSMFITTRIVWSASKEARGCDEYKYAGPAMLCCDASSKEKAIAGKINSFSDDMVSQAKEVFGDDNQVFTNMMKSYGATVANGPSQHGFTEAERSALRSSAITNNANQFRNVAGAVKSGQAAYGGGNTVSSSGTTTGQNLEVAQAAAGKTASDLNQVDQADWETGRQNYQFAANGMQKLPSTFDNMPGMNKAASEGLDSSLNEQKSLDAASGWWKKPVMGLVMGAANVATSGATSGLMSKIPGLSASTSGGGGGGSSPFTLGEG